MVKKWRPEGWEKIKNDILYEPNGMDKFSDSYVADPAFEAGADAMLEALRKMGVTARGNDGDTRVWGIEVFIPDDAANGQPEEDSK